MHDFEVTLVSQIANISTSTLFLPLVNLKFRFWASPSFLSKDFSAAEHPSSLLVSPQWRVQWHLIELHSDGE
jgi:hypothetical protein